jgi:hypothetical protein
MSGTISLTASLLLAQAANYQKASQLCAEAAERVREGRRPEDIAGALQAIRRAADITEMFDPAPIYMAYYDRTAANEPLFAALSADYPGEDWCRVFSIEVADPDPPGPIEHEPFYFCAKAASGRSECLLYDGARHDLSVLLARWARYLDKRHREVDADHRRIEPARLALEEARHNIDAAPATRLVFDDATFTVILDNTPHRSLDPTAFRVLKAIHLGGGKPVSSKCLLSQPQLRGKNIARELKKLPPALLALIKSKDGSGRWLELPSPSCP